MASPETAAPRRGGHFLVAFLDALGRLTHLDARRHAPPRFPPHDGVDVAICGSWYQFVGPFSARDAAETLHSRSELEECGSLMTSLASSPVERVAVIFMDGRRRQIACETMWIGCSDRCAFSAVAVVTRALELNASGVVLAHNHPSGDPHPSSRDILATRELVEAGTTLGVAIHDHLIVATEGIVSLRHRGFM